MQLRKNRSIFIFTFILIFFYSCNNRIDRFALVNRHNILLSEADVFSSLSVGNGEFAYTVDITGMQTFPDEYEKGIPLGTMSNWGWHSIPNDSSYVQADVLEYYESCNERLVPYAVQHSEGREAAASNWLRANPHRLHLGLVGLSLLKSNGAEVTSSEIENPEQHLNLWTGLITSDFQVEGQQVEVETACHQDKDQVAVRIHSGLIRSDQLRIRLSFPYGKECHVCPGYDWESPDKHSTLIISQKENHAVLQRTLDKEVYFVSMSWKGEAELIQLGPHQFEINPADQNDTFEYSILYSKSGDHVVDLYTATARNSEGHWKEFWSSGAAIDFSECTDPRAGELERRVVLSQYLTKIQCSGSLPPQETGLTFNSWYGKFHIEMHWWHAVHFALWGRPEYLEKSMDWYFGNLENARNTAQLQGYDGVRWQKMTSPEGLSSPSSVGEFLVWQQPHPIYFSELLYRADPSIETLHKYKKLVFESADFMASFAQLDEEDGFYHLCAPLIPAQEHFKAKETSDPAFELSYWYWGLKQAQAWRTRLGLPINNKWQDVIERLAPLPENDRYYLPTAQSDDAYSNFEKRRDHPIVVGAYGILPKGRVRTSKMAATFDEVFREWNWESTWGWDYPLLAMTATRLMQAEDAVEVLLFETGKNTYLLNGHNFQNERLKIYLPGNGGLLTAVAMMAAGFEGSESTNPGFPDNGQWMVKWEGLNPIL